MSFISKYAKRLGVLEHKGSWNASANQPHLQSGQGQKNSYYIVSVAGSTNLDGTSDWGTKDWVVFNGTTWEKIDNSEESQIVNSLSGNETDKAPSVSSIKNYISSQSIALNTSFVTSSEAEMLALSASVGSIAVRTDISKSYFLKQSPASTLANWQEVTGISGPVYSVAGKTGFVNLTTSDVLEGVNLYFTEERAQNALSSSLQEKANKTFNFAYEIHVSKSGNNTGSTGKPYQPFLTLAAAIVYAEATFTSNEPVVIFIHPGEYLENITITRPRTHLIGVQGTNAFISQIGSVTIAPTSAPGGVYNSNFSVEGLLIGASAGASACLIAAGTSEYSLHMRNVYLYADDPGQKGFIVTNTATVKPRFYLNDLLINNTPCGAAAVELSNSVSQIKNTTIYSGNGTCLKVNSTASVLAGFCLLETSGTLGIELAATTLTLTTSSVTASGANAVGVSVATGGTYTTIQNFYNVASGSGYAISGSAGGVVTHATNTFAYGSNNKTKNTLTLVSHSTTMVPSN